MSDSPSQKQRLSPEDWIKAGFRALAKQGCSGIAVEALARELEVTKGSFYWHFTNQKALTAAMLKHWRQVGTDDIIVDLQVVGDGAERLQALADAVERLPGTEYGGVELEGAIREWGRFDAEVAAAVKAVDERRIEFIARSLIESGLSTNDAQTRAALVYFAYVGLVVSRPASGSPEGYRLRHFLKVIWPLHDDCRQDR